MYTPLSYRQDDFAAVSQLIERDGFATLLTEPANETISHLPMILETGADGAPELLCHMARANLHWQEMEKAGRVKAIFHGPHAYISPAWYAPKPSNVPTWNYTVAHITGDFEILGEKSTAFSAMQRMVEFFENKYGTGWHLPKSEQAIDGLMAGIVVFRLRNLQVEAKFKLSQKHDLFNRESVIRSLADRGGEGAEVAEAMRKTLKT